MRRAKRERLEAANPKPERDARTRLQFDVTAIKKYEHKQKENKENKVK